MMTILSAYQEAIKRQEILADPIQREIVLALQQVADGLERAPARFAWIRGWCMPNWPYPRVQGLYICGSVGIGKTYLMDCFYEHVTETKKARYHFHQFMQYIDALLRQLQGEPDPLFKIANDLAKTTRLLCLDEFFVNDVADAMILSTLLQALFSRGIVLVATSNTHPDNLYLNGVQRDRFLPTIAAIKTHCEIMQLSINHDYRLGHPPLYQAYICPLDAAAHTVMTQQFMSIALMPIETEKKISIQNRDIDVVSIAGRVVWFTFDAICYLPRCQLDYLEIASQFNTVFVSDLPLLGPDDTVRVVLLMHLIDILYDQKIRLIISAAVPITHIYTQGPLSVAFQRTRSRLEEMQSLDYLKAP